MNLKRTLAKIATVVAEEAARNPDFQARLEEALGSGNATVGLRSAVPVDRKARLGPVSAPEDTAKRKGGRRSPAILDPVGLALHDEAGLRERLASLDLEQLHDIVAQYGMDPGKLVMKWRDRDRVTDRIIEVALARATKGDAFRME